MTKNTAPKDHAALIAAAEELYRLLWDIRDEVLPPGSLWIEEIDALLAKARGEEAQS